VTNEEFFEYVNELINDKGGIEKAIDFVLNKIEKLNNDFTFRNGENFEGENVEFFVEVLEELYYRIGMN
jgi:hypothetical protein